MAPAEGVVRGILHHGRGQGVPARPTQAGTMALWHARARAALPFRRSDPSDDSTRGGVIPKISVYPRHFGLFDLRAYGYIHYDRLFANPLVLRSIVNTT